jgi:hypothetical protein
MTDLHHPGHDASIPQVIEIHGYTVHLQQTALEWMAVITPPQERPSIILAADQETVLAKVRQWIEAHAAGGQESS